MAGERTISAMSLDLGSNLGYCMIDHGIIIKSGALKLSAKDSHPGTRFQRFQNFLIAHRHVKEIMYEDVPRFESAASAKVYCGLLSILQLFCLVQGINLTGIFAKSVKKEFAGNGNADKAAMCKVAHRLGWRGGHPDTDIDHDECDAIAGAWVILKRRGVDPNFINV